jgi:hypothetical protein
MIAGVVGKHKKTTEKKVWITSHTVSPCMDGPDYVACQLAHTPILSHSFTYISLHTCFLY